MVYISPALLLGICFSVTYSAIVHLGGGRSVRELFVLLLMGGIGFGFGQLTGTITQSPFLQIGELHLLEASIGAWLLLTVVYMIEHR